MNPLRSLSCIASAACTVFGFALAAQDRPADAFRAADSLFVEAEAFASLGGWQLDTQFVEQMGSPYLLAHGLGRPVADATTSITLPAPGTWTVWVRTLDWVAKWPGTPGTPGRFRVLVDGEPLARTLGVDGATWGWHEAGTFRVDPNAPTVDVALRDLTGFDGRCDALYFARGAAAPAPPPPTASANAHATWRRRVSGVDPRRARDEGPFDLVVVGGGYGGTAAALSAARLGCSVALIQNRFVLGGNGSSEVRVWAMGGTRRGPYPRLGEIVDEFADRAKESPGRFEEFGDATKEALVRAEPKISLYLGHHADAVETDDDRIVAVRAFDVRTGERKRFAAPLFADCTGHGTIGVLADAEHTLRRTEHLGASNMWRWTKASAPRPFPPTPWALGLAKGDFPYPKNGLGKWFWESGFDLHPVDDLEAVRDWNLRAVFGAFQAMKGDGDHDDAELQWIAYVSGTRESRQLLGDVVLTRDDIVQKRAFEDGCVPTTWDIDLHDPNERYASHPDNPFISEADFDKSVDKKNGYPVPYRCFYSRNLENLFMAGRCISVTHQALGTVRVMKTGGMVGEVVGKAASICTRHGCSPRAVYADHLDELKTLMRLPGRARRASVHDDPDLPADSGLAERHLRGLVFDDARAKAAGAWTVSTHEPGYVGDSYRHDGNANKGEASIRFTLRARQPGRYHVEMTWRTGGNRAARVPVTIRTAGDEARTVWVDETRAPTGSDEFERLLTLDLASGRAVEVTVSNEGTTGYVIVDAFRLLRADA